MKLFRIDIDKLGVLLLPTILRKVLVVEFIRISLHPLHYIQDIFFTNRGKNIYKLTHNSQVCSLKSVLNDAFPSRSKDFEIEDAEDTGLWQYSIDNEDIDNQLMVTDVSNIIIYDEEMMTKFADFVVKIPNNLNSVDNLNVVRALVNTYKLVSKKAIYEFY
ncbi:MAG: hypothetical protein PHH37_08270 [Paludibacter sp.]|nr:hypothetical protein [Paludibacter sp.]